MGEKISENKISENIEEPSFLEGYKVHEKEEAIRAAEKQELRTGEKGIVTDRTKRIQSYLGRLENVFLNGDKTKRERNIALLKPTIYQNTLVKEKDFPESYFEFQAQQARERGLGEVSFSKEEKHQEIEKARGIQEKSLDAWIDYLSGDDCKYPTDIKFFAMQGVLKLGKFDTEKYSFGRRNKSTAAPFCERDREALSTVLGALEAKHHKKDFSGYSPKLLSLIDKKNSFGDMYAETMHDLDEKADKESLLPITDGEWRVFEKGSDPKILTDSLTGKRSNLCIADVGAASRYLETGSVEIFFSYNHAKQPTVPRIAVAFNNQGVYEVRGTFNKSEDIDPFISKTDTLSERIKDLPNGEAFMKKDADMKRLTEIEKKIKDKFINTEKLEKELIESRHSDDELVRGRYDTLNLEFNRILSENTRMASIVELTKEELRFLYEIDAPIAGFGYEEDPRISEIIDQRNIEKDYAKIFDCKPEEITFEGDDDCFFPGEETVVFVGYLSFEHSGLVGLPKNLRYIVGDVHFDSSKIEDIANLESVYGDVSFWRSKVKSLKKLKTILGHANFCKSSVEDIGELEYIKGNVDVDWESKLDFSKVKIDGDIIRKKW